MFSSLSGETAQGKPEQKRDAGNASARDATKTWRMRPETARNMRKLLKEETNPVKAKAAFSLGMCRAKTPKTLEMLENLLASSSAPVRASAVYALGRSKKERCIPEVTGMLTDKSATVRVAACRALRELEAEPPIEKLPVNDPVTRVRIAACRTLAERGCSRKQADKLVKLYRNSNNLRFRNTVLQTLRNTHPKRAEPLVTDALREDDIGIRFEALKIVEEVNMAGKSLLRRIQKHLQASSPLLRAQACRTLYAVQGKKAKESLAKFAGDEAYSVRQTVAKLFRHFACKRKHLKLLHKLQGDPNRFVCRSASESLVYLANQNKQAKNEVIQVAMLCLGKKNTEIQCEGLWILGKLRSRRAFPELLQLAEKDFSQSEAADAESSSTEESYKRSRLITWVIKRTNYRKADNLLIKYSNQSADEYLRIHANRAIGHFKHRKAVPSLSKNLKETKTEMGVKFYVYKGAAREEGIWALGEIGNRKALSTLTTIATTKRPSDSYKNIKQACKAIVKHNYSNGASELKKAVVTKNSRHKISTKKRYILAKTYEELTGSSLDVSPPAKSYDTFFLNTSSD